MKKRLSFTDIFVQEVCHGHGCMQIRHACYYTHMLRERANGRERTPYEETASFNNMKLLSTTCFMDE